MRHSFGMFCIGLLSLTLADRLPAQLPHEWVGVGATFGSRLKGYGDGPLHSEFEAGLRIGSAYAIAVTTLRPIRSTEGGKLTYCAAGPPGSPPGCYNRDPVEISGVAASVVRGWGSESRPNLRVALGGGSYVLGKPNDMATSSRALGVRVSVTGALPIGHVGVTLAVDPIFFPNLRGSSDTYFPGTLGVRLWY